MQTDTTKPPFKRGYVTDIGIHVPDFIAECDDLSTEEKLFLSFIETRVLLENDGFCGLEIPGIAPYLNMKTDAVFHLAYSLRDRGYVQFGRSRPFCVKSTRIVMVDPE